MNSVIDEIKAKLSIEDLVSKYVQLKKAGSSLKGLCPFHKEKSPSFVVNIERQIAYCFGCNRGGDIFKFLQEIENVDFKDALKMLSERTGVKLEERKIMKKDSVVGYAGAEPDEKDRLLRLHEVVTHFYVKQLWETPDGQKVCDYLRKRGLNDENIKKFQVGFAPDSFDLTFTYLLEQGFTKVEVVRAGLAVSKETTLDKIYDKFRSRLMFPIQDSLGRIVAFGGRALKKDQDPKYLNSPETIIYHKSNTLYGYSHAKKFLKEKKVAVVVEGYMDLIACVQNGVGNVVAPCGTALTSRQLRLLKPFIETLCLAFDMDNAGREAAKRAFEVAQEFDFEVKILTLPSGKDPAEFLREHPQGIEEYVQKSLLYIDFIYQQFFDIYGISSVAAKRKIIQEFYPYLRLLKSKIEQDDYTRRLATDLKLTENQIYEEMKGLKLSSMTFGAGVNRFDSNDRSENERKSDYKGFSLEELVLASLLEKPVFYQEFSGLLSEDYFLSDLKDVYKYFIDQYNALGAQEKISFDVLFSGFDSQNRAVNLSHLKERLLLCSLSLEETYGELTDDSFKAEFQRLALKLKSNFLIQKARELQEEIRKAEQSKNQELCRELLEELKKLHIR